MKKSETSIDEIEAIMRKSPEEKRMLKDQIRKHENLMEKEEKQRAAKIQPFLWIPGVEAAVRFAAWIR